MTNDIGSLILSVMAINVNSFNVSSLGQKNAKTYLKIEGVTGKRADVIFLSDVRAKDKGEDLIKLFGLTRNGSYKLYLNSSRENRGVGIAIKRNISQDIKGIRKDNINENFLLLDVVVKGKRITLGAVYGPNENNVGFYDNLKREIELLGNKVILGGDFNTILCQESVSYTHLTLPTNREV